MLNRVTFRATFIALCTMLSAAAYAMADAAKQVDIPAGDLSQALLRLSKQYGADLVYRPEQVYGLKTHGAHGEFTNEQAVTRLLQGTPLELRTDSSGAMLIAPPIVGTATGTDTARAPSDDSKEGKKSASQDFRVAPVDQGATSQPFAELNNAPPNSNKNAELTEIIVTAQKRDERLQDVPVPVTAVAASSLIASNEFRLQDYYTLVPGLAVTSSEFNGSTNISIRGISSGDYTNPTVGITLDDMPFGSSTALGGGYVVPELDPSDLARIEVLRGPQGTLYGASSIGGLLKYVTVDPSLEGFSGRAQVGGSSVHGGVNEGYNVSGAVNIPLSDTWAVRASGFTRKDPGYIENIQNGERAVNHATVSGGHVSSLWRPSDQFLLRLSALLQDYKLAGPPFVTIAPGLGDLQQSFLPGTGFVDRKFQAYNATASAKLGAFDLISVTGYSVTKLNDDADYTSLLGGCCTSVLFPVSGTANTDTATTKKFTEELRLSGSVTDHLDLLLGGFYTHERSPFIERFLAANDAGGTVGTEVTFDWFVTYAETAGFADLTYRFTDRFDIQLGARESQIRQSYAEVDTGPYVPFAELHPSPLLIPQVALDSNAFTYLLTPRFRITPDLMVYARLASGYRPGGPNPTASPFGLPLTFKPDKTKNYEIGSKGDALDHKLSFDASLYYIDWQDIQLSLFNPTYGLTFFSNASKAKSEGAELSLEARPVGGLKISGSATWNNAVLTRAIPSPSLVVGAEGSRLPYGSRFSSTLGLEEDVALGGGFTGSVGGSASFVGDRVGAFAATTTRQDLPSYTKIDLRAGLEHNTWSGYLAINNITDKRGLLGGGTGTLVPTSFLYIQPRTISLSVAKTF
jgi:iron complex outermembrane recepter protein